MAAGSAASSDDTAKPVRKSRGRGLGLGLQVDPADLRMKFLTWRDWLYELRFSGSMGLLISCLLHGIVLVILALIIYELPGREDQDPYLATWLDPTKTPSSNTSRRKPVALPMTIAAVPTPQPTVKPTPAPQPSESPKSVDVQPAAIGGALKNRELISKGENAAVEKLGGTNDAQRAVRAGLSWLARQQTSEGKWELHQGYPDAAFKVIRTDTGATALALLAFQGAGHTAYHGEHAPVVKKGLKWLVDIQDPDTGDLHDQRQEEGRQPAFYAHAMATMALCEALALTQDDALRVPAEKAVKYLIDAQHPETGGWKYRPISKMMVGDLSVTGWALMALHTARMAGIEVAASDFERASAFLDSVQESHGARYKYEPLDPPQRVTAALTAEGLLCRQWLGWPKSHPPMLDGVAYLLDGARKPEWSGGRRNVYAWYYTSQMFHNLGGEPWEQWYPPVRDLIVRHQINSGSGKSPNDVRGSWHPNQPPGSPEEYGEKAGRLYVTVMCILILETPYRHQPLYAAE